MSKKKKVLTAVAGCAVVAVALVSLMGMAGPGGGGGGMPGGGGPGGGEGEAVVQEVVVDVTSPTLGDIVVTGEFIGTVEPFQQVTVYPKAAGEVLSTNFSVGDTVQQGDVLFQIDSSTLQNTIAQNQATLANSEAKAALTLEMAELDLDNYIYNVEEGYNSSLVNAENQIESLELALQEANNTLRTARRDYNEAITDNRDYRIDGGGYDDDAPYTDSQIEDKRNAKVKAELAVESAQLKLEQAKADLEIARNSVGQQETSVSNSIRSAELNADFTQQYLALQQLQKNLGDYTVTAPISGIIEERNIDPYDMASTQTVAYVISNQEAMTVSFNVSESTLLSMNLGDRVTVEKNGESWFGTISELPTSVDSGSGLYTIKATVENAPFALHGGSALKIFADTQKAENTLLVPIDAVYYDNGEPYVYVNQNGTAVRTFIETGISNTDSIAVLSGLSLSDSVISTWSSDLADGVEITLVGEVSQSSPTPEGGEGEPGEGPDGPPAGTAGGNRR